MQTKTAFDLIGYEGKCALRIAGNRRGRKLWDTVAVRDGYTDGPVMLQRLETTEVDGKPKVKVVTRSVDPDTQIELLPKPVGQTIALPGDSWIIDGDKTWHASGVDVIVESVHRPTKTVKVWVSRDLRMTDEDVKVGVTGQLDSLLAAMILRGDFSTDGGWDGKPRVIA